MRGRRTLLTLTVLLVVSTMLLISKHAIACESSENDYQANYDACCTFCDGDELTIKEKYEELIVKALTDEKNMLDDGIITEHVYNLQCEPFEKALDSLENATDEEIEEGYKSILIYFFDQTSEYEADGEEIDEEFLQYIMDEIEAMELNEELGL